ncbi:group III truncated hemoglobin [Chitinophaga rhizophila]|uniref:Group III truncated hemoglobin n=1 Tax=Chitinophaga rhizophila TaxID=2866212 RepID=A0ABS7GJ82_9BACT|nr:group III truncated hemoglobin [Chitinophaga rhizophila]MBW8687773.1 group III truncated hemoglobin [Chitinophaga rhizophila]
MKHDIETTEDVQLLVDTFYNKVRDHEALGYIFDDIAKVNWEKHLPVMYSFWETVLFGKAGFKGNPMAKHMALNNVTPLTEAHFAAWLVIWHQTIDDLFEGHMAQSAKSKAELMKIMMLSKMQRLNTSNTDIPITAHPVSGVNMQPA